MKFRSFLLTLAICILTLPVHSQFELTDLVEDEYPGTSWNSTPFKIPGDNIICWQFDKVDGTLASDSGTVAGSYFPNDPENFPNTLGQELRNDELDINYAVFRFNGGAKVFRSSGQWARYTVECTDSAWYKFKFRNRPVEDSTGYSVIVSVETADSVKLLDSLNINSFSKDLQVVENLDLTNWYLTRDSVLIPAGIHVIRIDIPSVNDEVDGQGKFGEFTFVSTDAKVEIKRQYTCGEPFELKATIDFPDINVEGFAPAYKDGGISALAINAADYKGVFAAARTLWEWPSGLFNISLTTLTETDGESSYLVRINGTEIGQYQNPETSTDYTEAGTTFENIELLYGDTIQVEFNSHTNGKIIEGNSTAYSRGRWTGLTFLQDCDTVSEGLCSGNSSFTEVGGAVIIEMEDVPLASGWQKQTSNTGYTGSSYIAWEGSNSFGNGGTGEIQYPIRINTPGTYQFKWRTRNGDGAAATDAENDSWLLIEADDYYGMKDGLKTDCNGDWVKVWIHSMNDWSWNIGGEHGGVNGMNMFARFDSPGDYKIRVSGRSKGHLIDRMSLYLENVNATWATSATTPASPVCPAGNVSRRAQVMPLTSVEVFSYRNVLVIELAEDLSSQVSIYNLGGQQVFSGSYHQRRIEQTLSLKEGLYLIRVQTPGQVHASKIWLR